MVLLPGLHGTAGLFRDFLELSPAGLQTRVVAFPGDTLLSYDELEELVWSQSRDSERWVLLGESFAGPLALRIAARRPQGLTALVLVASFAQPPGPRWARHLPWECLFRFGDPMCRLVGVLAGRTRGGKIITQIRHELKHVTPAVLALRLREVLSVDAAHALKACDVPVLYLRGTADHIVVRRRSLRKILKLRPDVVCEEVRAGHLVLQVAPEESWAAIVRFLRQLGLLWREP